MYMYMYTCITTQLHDYRMKSTVCIHIYMYMYILYIVALHVSKSDSVPAP